VCGSGGILADRQTDIHTERQTPYFATAPVGAVIISFLKRSKMQKWPVVNEDNVKRVKFMYYLYAKDGIFKII